MKLQLVPSPDSLAIQYAQRDFPLLRPTDRIHEALDKFRIKGLPHKIIYLYVAGETGQLLGVLPMRLLLTSPLDTLVGDVFVRSAISLPETATIDDAREAFAKYRFLAFPIVDEENRVLGVLDIEKFAGDLGDIHRRKNFDDIYELLGMSKETFTETSAFALFRLRFPWLTSTILAGTCAAFLAEIYEKTLQGALVLAFFMTLVLGLNESVCMQSATLALQRLHTVKPGFKSFLTVWRQELGTAVLLGGACGLAVGMISYALRRQGMSSLSIGLSLFLSILCSSSWGTAIPFLLRRLQKDPKVAAAPIALGLSDLSTLLLYFAIANQILR